MLVLLTTNNTNDAATIRQATIDTKRRTLDEVSEAITSPFSGVTAGSSSEWVIHGVNLLLTLIVYGFALGFLARVIRVRL